MSRLALALLLLAAPVAAADRDVPYEYEHVVVSQPVTVTGPSCEEVWLHLPVEGLMGPPYLKSCERWGGEEIVDDLDVTMHLQRRHPDKFRARVKVCDRREGRTQTFCLRLPYMPWPARHE